MMDSIDYTVFPNFHPWGAFNRIVYRFRPNGDDHRSSIMECIFLAPFDGERPRRRPSTGSSEYETFADAPELGMLAKVFDQDLFNMSKVQLGPRDDAQARRHPGELPGVEDPLAARPAGPLGRRRRSVVRGLIHPITKALYEQDGTGNVRVTHRGRLGLFSPEGRWISGELRESDPHLCGWIAGPQIASNRLSSDDATRPVPGTPGNRVSYNAGGSALWLAPT